MEKFFVATVAVLAGSLAAAVADEEMFGFASTADELADQYEESLWFEGLDLDERSIVVRRLRAGLAEAAAAGLLDGVTIVVDDPRLHEELVVVVEAA